MFADIITRLTEGSFNTDAVDGLDLNYRPTWRNLSDWELFGGMLPNLPNIVKSSDRNEDGGSSLAEFLDSVNSPNAEEVIKRYGKNKM